MTQNSTSIPGASLLPDGADTITTVHLIVLALLALVVLAGIVWGVRLKHRRSAAEHELRQHNEIVEAAAPPPSPLPAPAPAPRPAPSDTAVAPETVAASKPLVPATPPISAAPAVVPTHSAASGDAADPVAPAPAPLTGDPDGPVTQLKGLGPKVAAQLAALGVTTVGQIAALTDEEARALDARLGAFTGRMARDRWIEQARFLAAGDRPGFERVFGRL